MRVAEKYDIHKTSLRKKIEEAADDTLHKNTDLIMWLDITLGVLKRKEKAPC